jgi:hypothetical protein
MKYSVAIMFFFGFLVFATAQGTPANKSGVSSGVGLPIGEKAPAFGARDQFDRDQSNETLRGSNGTILLFFRSADW